MSCIVTFTGWAALVLLGAIVIILAVSKKASSAPPVHTHAIRGVPRRIRPSKASISGDVPATLEVEGVCWCGCVIVVREDVPPYVRQWLGTKR